MQPTVLLFDIDGTLVTTGGAGRKALQRVFGDRFGRPDVFEGFSFAGQTDPAIMREGFRRLGRPMEDVFDDYVRVLKEELAATREHRLHTGMQEILIEARGKADIALGLGTGNIKEGARAKLEPLGVFEHFSFGGFGSDHEDRGELIRIGAERGKALLGAPDARVVIIGDTPKDIAAARHIGAEVLAVTTGQFDATALAAADHVCASIAEAAARAFLLR